MNETPKCCVCQSESWKALGTRDYLLSDYEQLDPYIQKRYRVLFEVWCPNQQQITLTSSVCQSCGFVTNLPRPTTEEVDEKYRFVSNLGSDYGSSESPEVESRRADIIFHHCRKYLQRQSRILDYGGGDGRLMKKFADAGHDCFLIDYNKSPLDFVTKLGDTLGEMPCDGSNDGFDLIVCNHVIEHVPDPVEVTRKLGGLLKQTGTLYVEVPQEIWRKPPLHNEPVTHINFFVANSLRRVLEESGLQVSRSFHANYLHPSGAMLPSVCAIGHPGGTSGGVSSGVRAVQRFINPGLVDRLFRAWILRGRLPEAIRYKIRLKKR